MIECSTDNIYYKKRRRFKLKRLSVFFIIVIIIISLGLYSKYFISKQIYSICTDYVYAYSTEAVNLSVLNSVQITSDYSELIIIEKNSNDEIVLMRANSSKINKINKEVALETEKTLKNKLDVGIPVPLFAFLGIDLFRGYGPIIPYKTITVSSVVCNFASSFYSVGINQTLHSIYVEVVCNVKIQSIFNSKTEECKNKILISEAVLVGKVPEIYLSGKLFG